MVGYERSRFGIVGTKGWVSKVDRPVEKLLVSGNDEEKVQFCTMEENQRHGPPP